jgi:CBS domain containing-hemolysin-like protein
MSSGPLLAIAALIAASAFFSLAEISLAAARPTRLRQLAGQGDERARRVLALREHPGHFFTAVQIGLNGVAILGGIVGDHALSPFVTAALRPVYDGAYLETIGFLVSFVAVASAFVLFADLVPKRYAMARPEAVALALVGPMQLCVRVGSPLVRLFDALASRCFRLLRLPSARSDEVTAADIVAMAEAGAQSGRLLRQEQQMIRNVFELDARAVPSAMTPRDAIVFLALSETDESIRAKVAASPHGKFPVCSDGIDTAIGYVGWKDILRRVLEGRPLSLRADPIVRNLLVLPDTLTLFEALERFRDAKEDFALVVNEYALVVGLLTLEDVISTVMGELAAPSAEEMIVRRDERSWLVDGATPIDDVAAALGIDGFEGWENFDTIAGFIMYSLRKLPRRTDAVSWAGWKFEVVDIEQFRINQVLVTRETGP